MAPDFPPQSQLILPLLEVLDDVGPQPPAHLYPAVGELCGVPADAQQATNERGVNRWHRHVRWAEQQARRHGWTIRPARNTWAATPHGTTLLGKATPGTVTVAIRRPQGEFLWANALDVLMQEPSDSVDCYLTSPPYLLLRQKEYGGPRSEQDYLDWFLPFAQEMHRTLRVSGSLCLNLGLGPYLPGLPVRSPIVHRLVLALLDQVGFHLAGEHVWVNPAALPAPAEWVTVQRRQPKDGYELVIVLAKSPAFQASTDDVLVPYSAAQRRLQQKGQAPVFRPSGHHLTGDFTADHGGAIPSRVLTAANTDSNSAYFRACRAAGIPIHPARFPEGLPEWFIRWLTKPGDLVVDPFAGSGTTAAVAERLGRRWKAIEQVGAYIEGARFRWTA